MQLRIHQRPSSRYALALAALAAPAAAQVPNHTTTYMSNGTLTLGRDANAGGSITFLTDGTNGGNVINNHDSGRQIQSAVFDTGVYNPTQAGDGNNWVNAELFLAKGNSYIYSKSEPLLFYNGGCTPPNCGPRPVDKNRFYMWTEFLPGDSRAFTVKTLYRAYGDYDHHGSMQGQQVIPVIYQNGKQFTGHLLYRGNQPWTYQPFDVVNDLDITDHTGVNGLMTENWSSIVRVISGDTSNPWGLSAMSTSCFESSLFCGPAPTSCSEDGLTSDLQNATKVQGHVQAFAFDHTANGADFLREGRIIGFLGPVVDARVFMEGYRRQQSGAFTEDFQTNLLEWDANCAPVSRLADGVAPQMAARVGAATGAGIRDLSLRGKNWGDATYEVRTRLDAASTALSGYWGMAIRKAGEQHHDVNPASEGSGYYMATFNYRNIPNSDSVTFQRRDATSWTVLGTQTLPGFNRNAYHTLKVVANGFTFGVYVDNVLQFTATDTTSAFASGYVSLIGSAALQPWFDDVQVTPAVGAQQDGTAPLAVTGLTAKGNGSATQIDLAWTNPTATDWLWTRIVRREDATPTHWNDGQVVYEGKLNAYTDADVVHGHTYYYAVYAGDRAGNWSTAATQSASPMERWVASTGFSITQGLNQWSYRFKNAGGTYSDMAWNATNSRWSQAGTNSAACYINATQQSPAATVPSCRTWNAAQAGSARAVGTVKKVSAGGNGCTYLVQKKSGATVTTLTSGTIAAGDVGVKSFDVTTAMNANDQILFTLDGLGASAFDVVDWNPTVEFAW